MKTVFTAASPLHEQTGLGSVKLALLDLNRDFCRILPEGPGQAVTVRLDPALQQPESYEIRITASGADIAAADELGAIYGIYRFSGEYLGVDPLWFWKDVYPAGREEPLALDEQTIRSETSCFDWRGWFVNDEDLLTEWHEPSGQRHIDYPYYATVIAHDIAQAVYEAALRSGANLIIPASFLDITNPPEAKLIELAVQRGLYVSQHHIEPLGVSHFGFENYWKHRGCKAEFAFGAEPEKVHECWEHFAETWYRIAGDKVVWQLGLRGKGDRSIWHSDASVTRETAGEFISRALREQIEIIRRIDRRDAPPMTLTLWAEMSELMGQGRLTLPPGIIVVFSDFGPTQEMQNDFFDIPRNMLGERRGVYFHVALWARGPHLYAGVSPEHAERIFREVIAQNDTAYAIINVCNIREHVIGIESSMRMMTRPEHFSSERFLKEFAGDYAPLYREYFSSFHAVPTTRILHDGCITLVSMEQKNGAWPQTKTHAEEHKIARMLRACAERFDAIADTIPADASEFIRLNLGAQSRMMGFLYRYTAAIIESDLPAALKILDEYLDARQVFEQGKWTDWYRGDRKCNWASKRRELAKSPATAK